MANATQNRPLSPHLSVYRLYPTMVMSIVHRITGAALYFGTVLVAWWLIAAAAGPAYFEFTNAIFGSILGRLVLFAYTWALLHHMIGGIRHLVWDTGRGLEKDVSTKIAWATLVVSVALTIILWAIALIAA
ncbi:MAG: succinate dehydrogenase, cytochrome b556 subunit [Hyphomicrobiales bacterium]|nr:succinate dehydrogenase, cytochrome b556 subunit [Hyphomicrobiales bacterium]